jgi:hypothetical protein
LLGITAQRNLKYHPKFGASWNEPNDVARKQTKRKRRQIQTEALVDTGATRFYLQRRVIKALGLCPLSEITSRTMSDRVEKRTVSSSVKLAILRTHRTLRCHPTARHTAEHHRCCKEIGVAETAGDQPSRLARVAEIRRAIRAPAQTRR